MKKKKEKKINESVGNLKGIFIELLKEQKYSSGLKTITRPHKFGYFETALDLLRAATEPPTKSRGTSPVEFSTGEFCAQQV